MTTLIDIKSLFNEMESLEKEEFVMDLLIMLGEDITCEIHTKLQNGQDLFSD